MRQAPRAAFGVLPARAIPVTAFLAGAILLVSLTDALLRKNLELAQSFLNFDAVRVLELELWRVVTYPFVETQFWGLLLSILILWFFGGWFETRYGHRNFLVFFVLSSVGGALLAIPFSFVLNAVLPFTDTGIAEGPDAALDAMLVALALAAPDSKVLLGFVLPIKARTIVLVILGMQVVAGILEGAAALSITLGGMIMGWLLVTGYWRPLKVWRRLRPPPQRRGLHVVPPRNRTLN